MKNLEILTGEGNEILRKKSLPVKKFDAKLAKLAKDMKKTLIAAKGLGLAAPQVGENIRMVLVTLNYKTENQTVIAMVNPEIVGHGSEIVIGEEGCLSLPGKYENVERFKNITVEFSDLDGESQMLNLTGLNARITQHENDHLDGVLFTDRVKAEKKGKELLF